MSPDGTPHDPFQRHTGTQPEYPTPPINHGEPAMTAWPQPPSQGGYSSPPESPSRFKTMWTHPAVMVGVLGTIVILIVAVTVLALRASQPATGADGQNADAGDAEGNGAGNQDETEPADEAADGDAEYFTGTLSAMVYSDYEEALDFDTGGQAGEGSKAADAKETDAKVGVNGIEQLGGNSFGEWGESAAPTTIAECGELDEDKNSETIHLSRLTEGAAFCFTTTEGRTGYFVVDAIDLADNGSLDTIDLTFTVWKSEADM